MSNENYDFLGSVPPGVTVQNNVARAIEYQQTHTPDETANWFYQTVKNNRDGHLPPEESMDYKQISKEYADFGNYNYGVISKALGIPDSVTLLGAGWAQGRADGLGNVDAFIRAILDTKNRGDNPEDQRQIEAGIQAADKNGVSHSDFGLTDSFTNIMKEQLKDDLNWLTNQDTVKLLIDAIDSISNLDEWGMHFTELFPIIKKLNDLGHQIGQNTPLYDEVIETVKQQVTSAKSTSSPIILDLNNNGIETTGVKQGAYFDHANDGFAEQTGWVGANDGLLVRDLNGIIYNKACLRQYAAYPCC